MNEERGVWNELFFAYCSVYTCSTEVTWAVNSGRPMILLRNTRHYSIALCSQHEDKPHLPGCSPVAAVAGNVPSGGVGCSVPMCITLPLCVILSPPSAPISCTPTSHLAFCPLVPTYLSSPLPPSLSSCVCLAGVPKLSPLLPVLVIITRLNQKRCWTQSCSVTKP